ncbi:hypothetical protein D3C72_1522680 [compost metagenome]
MRIDEVHLTLVALLVVIDQAYHGFDRKTDAGDTDEVAAVVEHAVVDEHCHFVLVGHVQVDVDFIGRVQFQHTVVPGVARLLRVDFLHYAFLRLVVVAGGAGDEKCGVGTVLAHDFIEVPGDLRRVAFTG